MPREACAGSLKKEFLVDGEADAAEAPPLALGLEDPESADLPGRSDMCAAVSLDIEPHEIDNPHFRQPFWNADLLSAAQLGHVGDLISRNEAYLDPVIGLDGGVAGVLDGRSEIGGQLGEVEVHPTDTGIHRGARHLGGEVSENDRGEHVHT